MSAKAYVIVRASITDPEAYEEYKQHSGPAVVRYGGRFLARGGLLETLEGKTETGRVVLIEFPDLEAARCWYNSPEYQQAISLRKDAADAQFVLLEGS
ncbi:MAG: DUF1330 domain-containing protein [Gammaproteobacteria bacterium]|nr:DUF1330 domain-containing protein [Gammaproteobacteria bacterium]